MSMWRACLDWAGDTDAGHDVPCQQRAAGAGVYPAAAGAMNSDALLPIAAFQQGRKRDRDYADAYESLMTPAGDGRIGSGHARRACIETIRSGET